MRCKKLVILEGPDGAGKSTLADKLAPLLDGETQVAHHGPYLELDGLAMSRAFIDSFLPALFGEANVIMDRCWLSEPIYGKAFRGDRGRIDDTTRRQLERLAMRCGAVVVRCDPGLDACEATWRKRKDEEYLETPKQLHEVIDAYRADMRTELPVLAYDYRTETPTGLLVDVVAAMSMVHDVDVITAGRWGAKVVLVGEEFARAQPEDHTYQWPFGGLTSVGCSRWLTHQLMNASISERDLLWVNSDQPLAWLKLYIQDHGAQVFALGSVADRRLDEAKIDHATATHPQYHKRFHHHEPYAVIQAIQEALN